MIDDVEAKILLSKIKEQVSEVAFKQQELEEEIKKLRELEKKYGDLTGEYFETVVL